MGSIGSLISAVIVLVVVVGMYISVSYAHKKSGLDRGCNGNCGSCGMGSRCKDKE